MASAELEKVWGNYLAYYDKRGVDEKLINYSTQAAKVAIETEKDYEYGLEITRRAKMFINEYIYKETKGGHFFDLEEYAQKNNTNYPVLDYGYELYKLESLFNFESYMFYMEKNRTQAKRFYLPRRGTLCTVCRDLEKLENDEIDVYGLSLPARTGKLISDDTPVMTRNGWKNHGDLVVGDEVIGLNGEYVKVIHVFPKAEANVRVHFADHTYIDCHENHEWLVYDRFGQKERIVETKELDCADRYLLPEPKVESEFLKIHKKPISVKGIERISPKPGNCITVEGGIYRVGDRLKPTHNSSICIFFLSWVGLKRPWSHSAMGGHSGQLAKRFFKGLDNLIETPEYTFAELFKYAHPEYNKVIESKSSDPAEFTINLGIPQEYSTFCCRGIDGTWTGAIDVSGSNHQGHGFEKALLENFGYLYVDDLVRDREHSLSPSRMENTWQEYQNKMMDRMNDGAKKLLVGTLWSPLDPLLREEKVNFGNDRAFFRKIPALNEFDISNFQYKVNGFSTQYYKDMRDRLDKAEWMAKFQQKPFVREGLIYPVEELRFFEGTIPEGKCKTVAILDPAYGQGDNLSMPICKDFGEDKYIVAWIHDRRSPGYTIPKIVDAIDRHYITQLWIEKNAGGALFTEKIQQEMAKRGIIHCRLETYSAPERMHKEEKIAGYSDYVKKHFIFLTPKQRNLETDEETYYADLDYRKALDEMTTYSAEGKGRVHDDAPDAISSMAMKMDGRTQRTAIIRHSPI